MIKVPKQSRGIYGKEGERSDAINEKNFKFSIELK